jgi:asparagine synthase (glutamine-hydrolysing)
MPGLAGFSGAGARPEESLRALKRMRDLLSRGESRRADELFSDGRVCATRSHTGILQPQPQPFEKGGVFVWLEGEFYNREELEAMLDVSARRVTQPTDPSLLLALYAQGGGGDFDFLRRIDGIYAAVVYDSNARRVHLITDRYGLRHLFWARHGEGIAWASEVKAMLELPGFEPKIDRETVRDFIEMGHHAGDRTWFEGVELLPAGTVLTWDESARAASRRRYWWWDDIKPLEGVTDEEELAREVGRLFRASVERRSRNGGRVGLTLSGGLDSRAILAAMPDENGPAQAVTFGRKNCDDIRFAARAAEVKGAAHHVVELDAANWLAPRLEGVWSTDGQLNLMHMHIITVAPVLKRLFDVNLDGFLANAIAGGVYLGDKMVWNLDNRGRRYISLGPATLRPYIETRIPFFDNDFLELVMAIPERLVKNYYIYHKVLLLTFPEFFRDIPWQTTGAPISWPRPKGKFEEFFGEKKEWLLWLLDKRGLYRHPTRSYAHYADWIRKEPARSFFGAMLENPSALYAEYTPREQVAAVWASHLKGRDRADELCRFLTFEVWLRQVFEGEYRTAQEALPLMAEAG